MRPSNGARMVFFAIVARRFATVASACLARAAAASRSACAFASPCRSFWARPWLSLASDASASAAASCASSADVSSLTRTAPRLTELPDSKVISRTVPGSSAPRTTPRTATSEPIAAFVGSHSAASTFAAVTASGGGTKDSPARTIATIWFALAPTRTSTTTTKPAIVTIHCLRLLFMYAPDNQVLRGCCRRRARRRDAGWAAALRIVPGDARVGRERIAQVLSTPIQGVSRRAPRRRLEQASSRGDPELRARVQEIGVGLDAPRVGGERVPLRLQEVELRSLADLVSIEREVRRPRAHLRLDPRGPAARDVRADGRPRSVDVVACREPGALLARPRAVRRGRLRADARQRGEVEGPAEPDHRLPVRIAPGEPFEIAHALRQGRAEARNEREALRLRLLLRCDAALDRRRERRDLLVRHLEPLERGLLTEVVGELRLALEHRRDPGERLERPGDERYLELRARSEERR